MATGIHNSYTVAPLSLGPQWFESSLAADSMTTSCTIDGILRYHPRVSQKKKAKPHSTASRRMISLRDTRRSLWRQEGSNVVEFRSIEPPSNIYRTSIEPRISIEYLSNIYRKPFENLSNIYLTSIEHLSNRYRTFIETKSNIYRALNIYRKSMEHLSKIYRTSIGHRSNINRRCIENLLKSYRTPIERLSKYHGSTIFLPTSRAASAAHTPPFVAALPHPGATSKMERCAWRHIFPSYTPPHLPSTFRAASAAHTPPYVAALPHPGVEHLSNIHQTSTKDLSNTYQTSVEHPTDIP